MRRHAAIVLVVAALAQFAGCGLAGRRHNEPTRAPRPNILFVISDDQSWCHTSATGDPIVKTPNFDRIAQSGILFTNAYCAAPSCSPSRAAILTGQQIWRLREAANQLGPIPTDIAVLPDLLEKAGYHVGFTGKGWFPGDYEAGGRTRNPAGPEYNRLGLESYIRNFRVFLDANPDGRPFFFWIGCLEPHAPYTAPTFEPKVGEDKIPVPPFLPDVHAVRERLIGYYGEVGRLDSNLGRLIGLLRRTGLLDNTLIVVTSDNGIDLPRGKPNLYDYGMRMPFALSWRAAVAGGRVVTDFISLTDLAPTFLELAGADVPSSMTGHSVVDILLSSVSGRIDPRRDHVYFGRERHSPGREGNKSYPGRAIRTDSFLYIRNFAPDRWPAGDPPYYADVGGGQPIHAAIIDSRSSQSGITPFALCFAKRPLEELYDLEKDPDQLVNVAGDPAYDKMKGRLWRDLETYLKRTRDPRAFGRDGGWDTMPWTGRWRRWEAFEPKDEKAGEN